MKTGKSHRGALGRIIAAAVIAAAVGVGIAFSPPPLRAPAPPQITGEIQQFRLARNPRPVPENSFIDGAGQIVKLADFWGRAVLVNFWATWCAPCLRELPSLSKLQKDLGGDRFTVIALDEDRSPDGPRKFLKAHGGDALGFYFDPDGAVRRSFGVAGLPTSILIDPRGRVVGRLVGAADWSAPESRALVKSVIPAK